jgi:ribonucleoside-triphosphate reductase
VKYIQHFFKLNEVTIETLRGMKAQFDYGVFGEVCYYRTYSRHIPEQNRNEHWVDTVIRVMEGVMSIRKNHYLNGNIQWDEDYWQVYARNMAIKMFEMKWLPPGRGLWIMGAEFIAERGSMALYNCSFTNLTNDNFADDIRWLMDCLMLGVGVGFTPLRGELPCTINNAKRFETFVIPDSREGWCRSVELAVLNCTTNGVHYIFDYSLIRPQGEPIKGFGGTASGPAPLKKLHEDIAEQFYQYSHQLIDVVELKTNIANMVGVCVVAGNVRRSAELGLAPIDDDTFLDLKDYDRYPHRKSYGGMSNNSATLEKNEDFEQLGLIAERVPVRGEPGIANLRNFPKGRIGTKRKYPVRFDEARGLNPCGEITLEHREVCNIVETFPTKCRDTHEWLTVCEYATFYCSTVSLLPTHDASTNSVMLRNRRIGVGIADWTNWVKATSLNSVIKAMNQGYKKVRKINRRMNSEAGVPEAIKVTTVKPGGTVPKLAGRVSGIGYPTFGHTLRRITVAADNPVSGILKNAGVPFTVNRYDSNTLHFEFPIYQHGTPADQVSLWEQAFNLITVQRHWSDNAVSNTLYFKPKWMLQKSSSNRDEWADLINVYAMSDGMNIEEILNGYKFQSSSVKIELTNEWGTDELKIYTFNPDHEEDILERVMAHMAPHIKSASFLPHSAKGAYENMPEEGISAHEYRDRTAAIKPIDWTVLAGSDGHNERYCTGDACELVAPQG